MIRSTALAGVAVMALLCTAAAKAEFNKSRGPDFVYKPLIGDRKPPLDSRKNSSGVVVD